MNKGVEALDQAISYLEEEYDITDIDHILLELYVVKKLLTPPTSKKVCNAISKHLKEKDYGMSDNFSKEVTYNEITKEFEVECLYDRDSYNNMEAIIGIHRDIQMFFNIIDELPPYLMTMIGRFYEGVYKESQ